MHLLESLLVTDLQNGEHTIGIYEGDLTQLTTAEAVDLLIVSAYPNNYTPLPATLIGALEHEGISLQNLSESKEVDLRDQFSCWLSKDIDAEKHHFKKILCFEPYHRGEPTEVVADIFQALMPFVYSEQINEIAMPLVATGNQRVKPGLMLNRLLQAAVNWLERGMPIKSIKVVEINPEKAKEMAETLQVFKKQYLTAKGLGIKKWAALTEPEAAKSHPDPSTMVTAKVNEAAQANSEFSYDLFISYSRKNAPLIEYFTQELQKEHPHLKIFLDKKELDLGSAWQQELYDALDDCQKVVVFYSPDYLKSKVCKEEFNIAMFRHRNAEDGVLLPILLHDTSLPTYMKLIQYIDCREADKEKLKTAILGFARHF